MREDKGFRLPDNTDSPIKWPVRGRGIAQMAVWNPITSNWQVLGEEGRYVTGHSLVTNFGNDWYSISITKAKS